MPFFWVFFRFVVRHQPLSANVHPDWRSILPINPLRHGVFLLIAFVSVEFALQVWRNPSLASVVLESILVRDRLGILTRFLEHKYEVRRSNAALRGILIQQFLPIGNEFIIGAIRDPNFGPLVMVGLGGIYTELFRDTCFALAPVTENQAYDMLSSLKSWKLLTGMRGKGALDIDALAKTICKISTLMTDCPTLCEIDLNPVLVAQDKIVIADAKVVVADRA